MRGWAGARSTRCSRWDRSCWRVGSLLGLALRGDGPRQRPFPFVRTGVALLGVPALLAPITWLTGSAAAGFLGSVTVVVLGLPGAALVLIGLLVHLARRSPPP